MADVHLIDAEKGGVGKSLVARTLLQLFLDRECPVIPMEADRSNPTFSNIYGDQVLPAIFSEDREYEDAPDAVFDIALQTPVIVDLPAQAHRPLSLWLKSKGLLDLGQANGVRFLKWFVCDGGLDSIHLFLESVKYYGDRMPHTLVKNLGRSENWSALESSEAVQSAIVTYGIKTIEFPRLSPHKLATIDAQRMTFSAARDSTDLGLIGRSQIVTYLKTAYAALDQSGWTPGASLNLPPARKGESKS